MDAAIGTLYFSDMAAPLAAQQNASMSNAIPAFFLYGEEVRSPDEATIHIETIAARSRLCEWTIRPHRHNELYQILVVRTGSVAATLDERLAVLPAPAFVVVPPSVVHSFRFETGTAGLVVSFASGIARDLAAGSRAMSEFFGRPTVAAVSARTFGGLQFGRLSGMLLREFAHPDLGRECALRGLLGVLTANIYRLSRVSIPDGRPVAGRQREIVDKFRELIEAKLRRRPPIPWYCRAMSVSEPQLRRACKVVTGQSPVALVQSRLVIEAERLLRYTSMSITQVAYHLGFDDPAYFTRFFIRACGSSPTTFRGYHPSDPRRPRAC